MSRPHLIVCMPQGSDRTQILELAEQEGFSHSVFSFEKSQQQDHFQLSPGDCMLIDGQMIIGNGAKELQDRVHFSSRSKIYLKVADEVQKLKAAVLDLPVADVFNGKDTNKDIVQKMKRSSKTYSEVLDGLPMLFTRVGNKLKRIHLDEVDLVEVEGKYCAIVIGNRRFHVKSSMREMQQKLNPNRFIRVSRNFLINVDRIEFIDVMQWTIRIGDHDIPLSRTYKENLMSKVTSL